MESFTRPLSFTHPAPSRRLWPILLTWLCVFVLLTSCSSDDEEEKETKAVPGIKVSVQALNDVAQTIKASAPGRIVSLNDTLISAEVGAKVESILHRRGDTVKKGELLIELDCRLYRYRLGSAQSRLDIARSEQSVQRKDYDRHIELFEQKLISEETFLAKKNLHQRSVGNLKLFQSEMSIANRDVENCSVVSPFDAAVMDVHVSVGELLQPGARLARVLDISTVEVWADLSPWYAGELNIGDKAFFTQSGTGMPLELISKSAIPDTSSGNYKARFRITGLRQDLSGSGEVVWQTTEKFLSDKYLRKVDDSYGVMILEDKRARFFPIANAREGRYASIAALDGTMQVIVDGREKVQSGNILNTGARVRQPVRQPVPQPKSPAADPAGNGL